MRIICAGVNNLTDHLVKHSLLQALFHFNNPESIEKYEFLETQQTLGTYSLYSRASSNSQNLHNESYFYNQRKNSRTHLPKVAFSFLRSHIGV